MGEGGGEESIERLGSLASGVDKGVEQDGRHLLDLGVGDDLCRRDGSATREEERV